MRPRNKREQEVLALSRTLPRLNDAKKAWMEDKVVERKVFTSGKTCWCSRCGHVWKEQIGARKKYAVCPECGSRGEVARGRMQTGRGQEYAQYLQTYKGYQVVRYTVVEWYFRKGRKQHVYYRDVMQKWCQPGKPTVTLGVGLSCYPWNCAVPYSPWGGLQIKQGGYYEEWMPVRPYPHKALLPVYRKNLAGKPGYGGFRAIDVIGGIFTCPYLERLWKSGETEKVKDLLRLVPEFNKYWPSVKVAVRHGWEPEHWISYFDYLKALRFLHYDMRSPRYVAPPDWQDIHDRVMTQYGNRCETMRKRREAAAALRRAQEEEERMRRAEEYAKKAKQSFARRIKKFADLCITDGKLVIKPLMTIKEFKEEGEAMNHCVFRLGYYKKPESLILSARMKGTGKRVETVEVNLNGYTIWQSRGFNNQSTPYHDEIVSLVTGAMPQIRAMARPKRKTVSASRS